MDVPCSLALSIYGFQLLVTIPIVFLLRNARDRALMKFRAPRFSLEWIVFILLLFVAVILPLIVMNLWTVVACLSAGLTLVTLGLGISLGR